MTREKACLNCKIIFEGEKCPICNGTASTDAFKGRLYVFNVEDSEIAKNMKIKQKGQFAIKVK
ncbi:MAG: transcription elongation factor subunit Spt4 [Nanoarchaeota archaeon]